MQVLPTDEVMHRRQSLGEAHSRDGLLCRTFDLI